MRRGQLDIAGRLEALDRALELAGPRLDDGTLAPARDVRVKVDERLARGDGAVVAALAGGTGSGKSSLLNALAGHPVSEVGARRPTTGEVVGWAIGDPAPATALLDWLGVRRRYHAEPTPMLPEGLVVLDLPDQDSVVAEHRAVADALVARVDILVWVVDPLKYAQRLLHERYLRRLATHAEVVVVVLNQVDRLDARERKACLTDLRRILSEEGLGTARVLATSAVTGEGVNDLRALLADEARQRRAVGARLDADLRAAALTLREATGSPVGDALTGDGLIEALGTTAGVTALAAAARARYRAQGRAATRPLVSRVAVSVASAALRPFTAMRGPRAQRPILEGGTRPDATPAAVRHALAQLAATQGAALPVPWRASLRSVLNGVADDLPAEVGRATRGVDLSPRRRRWWLPVGLLWTLAELTALAGLSWLGALAVLDYLRLPLPDVPAVAGRLPWPTALLIGGLLAWLLLWLIRSWMIAAGATRHRNRVRRQLRAAVARVAEDHALARVRAELAAHDAAAKALERASR